MKCKQCVIHREIYLTISQYVDGQFYSCILDVVKNTLKAYALLIFFFYFYKKIIREEKREKYALGYIIFFDVSFWLSLVTSSVR